MGNFGGEILIETIKLLFQLLQLDMHLRVCLDRFGWHFFFLYLNGNKRSTLRIFSRGLHMIKRGIVDSHIVIWSTLRPLRPLQVLLANVVWKSSPSLSINFWSDVRLDVLGSYHSFCEPLSLFLVYSVSNKVAMALRQEIFRREGCLKLFLTYVSF